MEAIRSRFRPLIPSIIAIFGDNFQLVRLPWKYPETLTFRGKKNIGEASDMLEKKDDHD